MDYSVFQLCNNHYKHLQARGKKRQKGWFPASHVKLLGPSSEKTTSAAPPGEKEKRLCISFRILCNYFNCSCICEGQHPSSGLFHFGGCSEEPYSFHLEKMFPSAGKNLR